MNTKVRLSSFILRAGLAIVLLYAAISSLMDPASWVGFLPEWAPTFGFDPETIVTLFAVYQILLASWLISGFKSNYAGSLSAVTFLAIIAGNIGAMAIVFRDIALLFASIAVTVLDQTEEAEAEE